MNLLHSLENHHAVCEEVYRVMLDLNRRLKAGVQTPEEDLLSRQRTALADLDRAFAELRRHRSGATPETRAAMEKCQRTIMKALLLDRENEQLLLKNAMVRPAPPIAAKPSVAKLARTYAQH